jgi:type VI secretion system protein ImpG
LLEGFSFLSARVRLKLDAEFPRFAQHLLEVVYPHYLAPIPAMAITQFAPAMTEAALATGFVIPRRTILRGQMPRGEVTACQFRTAHDVTLWPVELVEARYVPQAPDLPLNAAARRTGAGVLRLRLRAAAGLTFSRSRWTG